MFDLDPLYSIAEVIRRSDTKGNSYRAGVSQMQRAVRAFIRHQNRGGGRRAKIGAARGRREAMVKIVRRGGASTAGQLKAQMNYLSRNGHLSFEGSEAYGGDIISEKEAKELADMWAESWKGKTNFGQTRHLVVSYPMGTSAKAAHAAGREFAERAFASGEYGDCWDYVTAFHTDGKGAHPHLHIIVNCKGMDHGQWLKTGKDAALSVDELRALQVETALNNGIVLTHTTRLERGLSERATDGGYWREQAGKEVAEPINRDPAAEAAAAAAKAYHGMAYATLAEVCEEYDPAIATALRSAADQLREGKQLSVQLAEAVDDDSSIKALEDIATRYASELEAISRKHTDMTTEAGRDALAALEADTKERLASWFPDRPDLAAYTVSGEDEARVYHDAAKALSLPTTSAERLIGEAQNLGIDIDAMVSRAQLGTDISLGRVADWMADDLTRHLTHREGQGADLTASEVEDGLQRLSNFYESAARALHIHQREHADHSEGHEL